MSLSINTLQETTNLTKADIQNALSDSQPFLPNSFLSALAVAVAGRKYDSDNKLIEIVKQSFPQTATGENLEFLGEQVGATKNPATKSSGYIIAAGTINSSIPSATSFQSSAGNSYVSSITSVIVAHSVTISSINSVGGVAKATTSQAHDLGTGMTVLIAGATQSPYNGSKKIITTGEKTFEYEIAGSPTSETTTGMTVSNNQAKIKVESVDFGSTQNAPSGSQLTITTPIAGVDSTTFTYYAGISGGTDIESENDFRIRVMESWQNIVANFNDAAIILQAKLIAGVTRVWVKDCTPQVGQVTVYFVRDNDDDIIPDANEIAAVKASILLIKPATSESADVIVAAPTPVSTNFIFSSVTPNTEGIKQAIRNNLQVLFADTTEEGTNIPDKAYLAAIYNSIDLETGQKVTDYTLTSPTGTIAISDGELATLGSVTFNV